LKQHVKLKQHNSFVDLYQSFPARRKKRKKRKWEKIREIKFMTKYNYICDLTQAPRREERRRKKEKRKRKEEREEERRDLVYTHSRYYRYRL
jgi:hypothetical protein